MSQEHKEAVKNVVRKLSSRPEHWINSWMDQYCPVIGKTPNQAISSGEGEEFIKKLTELHQSETKARNRIKVDYKEPK